MEEITESDNSENNEEKNVDEEENMDVGDFSSNLEGYLCETSKEEMDVNNEKNIGSSNVCEEDTNQSKQSLGVREGKEVMEKEKEELSNKDANNVKEDTRKETKESMGKEDIMKIEDRS